MQLEEIIEEIWSLEIRLWKSVGIGKRLLRKS